MDEKGRKMRSKTARFQHSTCSNLLNHLLFCTWTLVLISQLLQLHMKHAVGADYLKARWFLLGTPQGFTLTFSVRSVKEFLMLKVVRRFPANVFLHHFKALGKHFLQAILIRKTINLKNANVNFWHLFHLLCFSPRSWILNRKDSANKKPEICLEVW